MDVNHYRMKLQLGYDTGFSNLFGSNVNKHLNGIMVHAVRFYKHQSLGTQIFITPGTAMNAGTVQDTLSSSGGCSNDVGLR